MTIQAGTRLGPYEILAPIGAGGMGEVYRARDTRLGRDVAVKVLPSEFASDSEHLRRFEREAKAVAALSHPNILSIFDYGHEGDTTYAVMELLEGETLRERLTEGPLPASKAADIASQITKGLAAAHEKGIVHRDLKPGNVFLTRAGHVKILDFGLARLAPQAAEAAEHPSEVATEGAPTHPGAVLGTVGYMAPEQARGGSADARSDIFAFGVVLYEMLSGKRAFERGSAMDTLAAILKEDPPPLPPVTPPGLDRVVRRCLEKKPEDRFSSARDLAFALEAVSDATPAPAPPPAPKPSPPAWYKRGWVLTGAAVLLIALVSGGLWLWKGKPSKPAAAPHAGAVQSIAIYPLDDLSGDAAHSYFAPAMTEALNTKLTQIRSLRVVGQVSAAKCKEEGMPLPEVAKALGVDAVVQGSVVHVGDTVRISVRLLDAKTDSNLWAESYERQLTDVLVLQGEVAHAIALSLSAAITPEEKSLIAGRKVNPDAYDLYLEALSHMELYSDQGYTMAIAKLKRAIELEPEWAQAYARIAECYNDAWFTAKPSFPYEVAHPLAKEAALKAVEIGPNESFSHNVFAWVLFAMERDLRGAERESRRALDLNEREQDALLCLSLVFLYTGRAGEAIELQRQAVELDPRNPQAWGRLRNSYFITRRYNEAKRIADKARELTEKNMGAGSYAGMALGYALRGDRADALRCIEKAKSFPGWDEGRQPRANLAIAYAALGMRPEAEEMQRLTAPFHSGHPWEEIDSGICDAWLGETGRALEHLDRAASMPGSVGLRIADVGMYPEAFTQDPRYGALLSKYGIVAPGLGTERGADRRM